MKKDDVLKFIEEKGDTSYIIRTETDDKAFLDNYGKSVLEKELDPAIAKIHNQYDDDLEKIFGKRKKPGEKTYNFMKSEFQSWKEKADRVEQLESEIEGLKKGSPDVESKLKEIKALQGQMKELKDNHDKELALLAKQNLRNTVKSEIERGLLGIKIKSGIPDTMKQVYVDAIVNELSDNAEFRDGKIVFLDKEGKSLRDPQTMLPFTAEALLKDRMKDVIDTGRKVDGPGITDPVGKDDKGKAKLNVILPDSVNSREKLGEYLVKELGIKNTSQQYRDLYHEYGKDLPVFK